MQILLKIGLKGMNALSPRRVSDLMFVANQVSVSIPRRVATKQQRTNQVWSLRDGRDLGCISATNIRSLRDEGLTRPFDKRVNYVVSQSLQIGIFAAVEGIALLEVAGF